MEPLPLKAVSREEVDLRNRLFERGTRIPFSLGPDSFVVVFPPSEEPFVPEVSAGIEMNGRVSRLDLDRFFFRAAVEDFLGGEDFAVLPPEVREAAAEVLLERLVERFETWSGGKAAFREIHFPPAGRDPGKRPVDPGVPLPFRLLRENGETGGPAASGRLCLDRETAGWLRGLLDRDPPLKAFEYDRLPVEVRVEIGRLRLTLADLKGLERDDVLLAERGAWEEGGEAVVRAGGRVSFPATLEGRTVTVREGRGKAMDTEHLSEKTGGDKAGGESPASNLDELEITLLFDVGSREIPLGELKTIRPGYTFELEGSPERPVTIRANGKRIGSGELVRVADRVGVRVLALLQGGNTHDDVS